MLFHPMPDADCPYSGWRNNKNSGGLALSGSTQKSVLVLAEHDTTLNETAALFEQEGYKVHTASGEDDVSNWLTSLRPSLLAYRLCDPATRRTVCRTTLQAVAAHPGPRLPTLALCEPAEATAAAALCKEGLADDYLLLPHLHTDLDRLPVTIERLIALRDRREVEARDADAIEQLWSDFSRFDFDMQYALQRIDADGQTSEAGQLLTTMRTAQHRAKCRLSRAPVLVVDDDPDFQLLLKTLVAVLGHPVVGASDANEALDWLERNEPSLILLDYQMPGQDGVCFLEWIRKSPRLKPVPVMMLTGHSRPDTVQRVRKLGINDFIVKPSDPPTIMKKISAYL